MSEDRQRPVTQIPVDSPLHSLCHLNIHRRILFGTKDWRGTASAVLFRDRYLLTAGHNVYQDKSSIKSVEVRVGATDAKAAPVHETIEAWQALDAKKYQPRGWRRRMPFDHDYGVIRLNTPVNVPTQFGLAQSVQSGDPVHFAGYPGGPHNGWTLHSAEAVLDAPRRFLVGYDLKTYKSNSGGPVWSMADGSPRVVAVHVTNSAGRIVDAEFIEEVERLIGVLDQRAANRGLA